MKETIQNCYCDISTEHNNQKVLGASSQEVVVMVLNENTNTYYPKSVTLDLCPACQAKFASNLYLSFGPRGKAVYTFES